MPANLGEIRSIRLPSETVATPIHKYTDDVEWDPIFEAHAAAQERKRKEPKMLRRSERFNRTRFLLATPLGSRTASAATLEVTVDEPEAKRQKLGGLPPLVSA